MTDAELSLRTLMEQGLKEQRYADVSAIAGLAEGLARLLAGAPPRDEPVNGLARLHAESESPRRALTRVRLNDRQKKEYPRFEREDDKLVKIGWSKKNRSVYEHKAPRSAVLAFVRHLQHAVSEGEAFSVEDILPVPDLAANTELPDYQVYLVLAWLRRAGAIQKKARDQYVVRRGQLSDTALDRLWVEVAAR